MIYRCLLVGIITIFLEKSRSATVTVLKNDSNETVVILPAMSSSFGPKLYDKDFFGHVSFTIPLNACSPVRSPPSLNSSSPFIALARRHDCSFFEKVLNAQQAGFKGVIIFDPTNDDLVTMGGGSESVFIYSVFIGKTSEQILSKYLGTDFIVKLEEQYLDPFGFMLIPLIIGFSLCLIFVIVFWLLRRISGLLVQWRQRLSRSVVKLLPLKRFKSGDSYDTCAVCLEDFKVNDKLRLLPCSHAYHQTCIDPWLTEKKSTCPLCNKPIGASECSMVDNQQDMPNEQTPLINNQAISSVRPPEDLPGPFFGRPQII